MADEDQTTSGVRRSLAPPPRICLDCGADLTGMDPRSKRCLACRKIVQRKRESDYRRANPQIGREKRRRWVAANPERAREQGRKADRKRYALNREHVLVKNRRSYAANHEKRIEAGRKRYAENLEKFRRLSREAGHKRYATRREEMKEKNRKWRAEHPERGAWTAMKQRCLNPANIAFESYGGRGITVCRRWLDSFENFFTDVGPRPSSLHHLHRWDVDGNYEPGNVSWNIGGVKRTIKGLEAKITELEAQLRDSWQQEERDAIEEAESNPA